MQPEKFWVDDTVLPDEWALFSPRGFRGPITKAELVCYFNTGLLAPDIVVCHMSVDQHQQFPSSHTLEEYEQRLAAGKEPALAGDFPTCALLHLPS